MTRRRSKCALELPLDRFRVTTTRHGQRAPHSLCKSCESSARYARAKNDGSESRARRHANRLRESARKAARSGRDYIPREERKRRAAARAVTPTDRQLRSNVLWMLRSLFAQRCVRGGEKPDSVEYRWRYRSDPAFREKEIARRWATKEAQAHRATIGDGSLTSRVLRAMFAAANECLYCGGRMTSSVKTLDHVIPRSRGGAHSIENVVVCCRSCNCAKKTRTLLECAMASALAVFAGPPRMARLEADPAWGPMTIGRTAGSADCGLRLDSKFSDCDFRFRVL